MDQALEIVALNGYLPLRAAAVLVIVCFLLRRRNRPAPETLAPFIGNMSNNIYHSNQCKYGRRIGKANREAMFSHAEALHSGYRPCKECLGPFACDLYVEIIAVQTPIAASRVIDIESSGAPDCAATSLDRPAIKLLSPPKKVA